MDAEHYLHRAEIQSGFIEEEASLEKWKSLSSGVDEPDEANTPRGFECNICLDVVQDPVVTICGHLYCWPCIYRWISCHEGTPENPDHQQARCPVCKSELSEKTLIPLYGRGQTTNPSNEKASDFGIPIPQRPPNPGCGVNAPITNVTTTGHSLSAQHRQQSYVHPFPSSHMASPMTGTGGMTPNVIDPMVGMFVEMACSRIFGNSDTTLYAYPNSYHLAVSSPRVRRRIEQADKSLSRVCCFLFCCVILCLLLF